MKTFSKFIVAASFSASLTVLAACSPHSDQPQSQEINKGVTANTTEVMRRFNQAFEKHDPAAFPELIAQDCVMESMQPAPDGTRYVGYEANLSFWQALATDRSTRFETEEMSAVGDRAIIRWRIHFGEGQSLRGVTLLRIRDGKISEALAYSKVPGEPAPLPAQQ